MNILKAVRPLFAAAVVLLSTAIAHADSGDQQFLAGLGGIPLPPDQAITYAHRVCDAENLPRVGFAIGPTPLAGAFQQMQNELAAKGLTEPQMVQLKRTAITTYCPDKRDWP